MATNEPIAIVGIGGIFPGARTPQEFWANVVKGRDCTGPIPRGRWPLDPAELFDPRVAHPDRVYSATGGFVDAFPWDPSGFQIDAETLATLDPLFRLALYAAKAAWSGAKTSTLDLTRVGVIFGHIVLPTETSTELSHQIVGRQFEVAQGLPGLAEPVNPVDPLNAFPAGLPAKIVARALGLGGRAFTLDAACASSLYGLALAVEELRTGRADAMIAGGLSRPDPLFTQMGFSQLRALSARGKPAPFDTQADGLVVGEGSGMFVLKRLSDAIAQGDHIHGLIAGIGLSNDIHGDLLAPNSEGQLRAMRLAYEEAGWSPRDVDLIECHATGTPVGDAVEVESLKTLWNASPQKAGSRTCVIGSAKSNYGHALTAAGSAGLLKVLMALKSGILPPTANFERAAPKLGLEQSPFRVMDRAEPWPSRGPGQPRRAAISGFGFGGINAHVLIEEWIPEQRTRSLPTRSSVAPSLSRANSPIAIVGMSAHFGPESNLREFQSRVLTGESSRPDSDDAFADFSLRLDQFRIPPVELEAMLPQQSLMLKVAQEAIADSVWVPHRALKTGVMIGIGLDLNTTNFELRWTMPARARQWDRELGFESSDDELRAWIEQLLSAAGPPLTANRTMGALGGLVASRIAREFRLGGPSFTISDDENSGNQAIMVAVDWLRSGRLDAAVVGAVDFPSDPRIATASAQLANVSHLRACDGAGALILKRLDDAIGDGNRIYAVIGETEAVTRGDDSWRAGRVSQGDAGAASGLASTIKSILSIYQQILPGTGGPQFWARNRDDGPRRAEVRSAGLGGSRTRMVLEEFIGDPHPKVVSERQRPLARRDLALFALGATDVSGLQIQVESLARLSEEIEGSIEDLARRWWQSVPRQARQRLNLAIVATDRESLRNRLGEALDRLAGKAGSTIRRPGQRDLLAFPNLNRGDTPRVAFVYPGLGNSFAGMGRELSTLWPEVMRRHEDASESFRDQITRGTFWNQSLPSHFDDHVDLIVGQVAVGSLVTDIFPPSRGSA